MGAQGTTTVDFGAFPGKSDATATVTGQATILAGSIAEAWIWPVATADHTADEHRVETIQCRADTVVAGTGFTIFAWNTGTLNEPIETVPGENSIFQLAATTINQKNAQPGRRNHLTRGGALGGTGTRLYGLWTVAWVWN